MAAKKKQGKPHGRPSMPRATTQVSPIAKPKSSNGALADQNNAGKTKWIILFILIITVIAFIPALKAGFVNWDDGDYVNDNVLIRDWAYLKNLVTTPVQGNHHPLTMISLAFNYQISGDEAWSYHLLNLLLHLVNCVLVFRLTMLLSHRRTIIAFTTAVLFAIHPMHVESVAWISERKDVLYGLFFLGGLITYTKYVDENSKKYFVLTIILLVLSLLSKPAAVIFPVVLFCIDILRKRPLGFKLFAEKIPFFILALILGIITVKAQGEAGATGDEKFAFGTLVMFGFYGIMMYMVKLIAPINLSPFYPFPPINESLPWPYFVAPVFFIGLIALVWYTWKKNRVIAFGLSFYIANLILVLQVFSVGSAVIAERYTYLPYIGLFYIIGWLIDNYANGNTTKASYIILPISVFLAILTFKQSQIWTDGQSLWTHTINTNPSSRAYGALGVLARKEKDNKRALEYYTQAVKMNAIDHESYSNIGNIYLDEKNYELAFQNFRKSIAINPGYFTAMDNMGAAFAMRGQYDSALKYLTMAIEVNPVYKNAYSNRALTYMSLQRYEDAIKDWETYLKYDPQAADVYNTIGLCYRLLGKSDVGIGYINKAISMKEQAEFYMNRAYTQAVLKNNEQAKRDALKAQKGGVQVPEWFLKQLGIQ